MAEENDACSVAHGETAPAPGPATPPPSSQPGPPGGDRALVAVFASAVSGYLLRYAADAGYRCLLVDPDPARASAARMGGFAVAEAMPDNLDGSDVVVTDHHRDELGVMLRDALAAKARWVGIMGNPHHAGPHVEALEALGVAPGGIARVHRPIGLNIGSRTPPEIAISTLAGLLADRNSRPGGFSFLKTPQPSYRTGPAGSVPDADSPTFGLRSGGVTPAITLRTATAADFDPIIAVVDDWWGRPIRRALPRVFLDHFHATSTVAEADGALAGFLIGFLSPSQPDAAYIHFVGVDPARRGNGLARTLYERFFALAEADARSVVRAITAAQNAQSIAFHTAMGFTVTDPIPDYDGDSAPKVVFERRLLW